MMENLRDREGAMPDNEDQKYRSESSVLGKSSNKKIVIAGRDVS